MVRDPARIKRARALPVAISSSAVAGNDGARPHRRKLAKTLKT